jgi:hypothetical protein
VLRITYVELQLNFLSNSTDYEEIGQEAKRLMGQILAAHRSALGQHSSEQVLVTMLERLTKFCQTSVECMGDRRVILPLLARCDGLGLAMICACAGGEDTLQLQLEFDCRGQVRSVGNRVTIEVGEIKYTTKPKCTFPLANSSTFVIVVVTIRIPTIIFF